jgi:hypothetical protein
MVTDYREKASFKRGNGGYTWSVWHRYSEYEALDTILRKTLAWRMDSIEFPAKNSLTSNLSQEFLDKRMQALDQYIALVMQIPTITEFDKHTGCDALKEFIQFDKREELREAQAIEAKKAAGVKADDSMSFTEDFDSSDGALSPAGSEGRRGPSMSTARRLNRSRTLRRKSNGGDAPLALTNGEASPSSGSSRSPTREKEFTASAVAAPKPAPAVSLPPPPPPTSKPPAAVSLPPPPPPTARPPPPAATVTVKGPAPGPAKAAAPAPAPAKATAPAPAPAKAGGTAVAAPKGLPPPQKGRGDMLAQIRAMKKD